MSGLLADCLILVVHPEEPILVSDRGQYFGFKVIFLILRRLCLVLGDQLNADSLLFNDFDPQQDRLWMAEVPDESRHVWSHKQRIVLFLSAMRHFADDCRKHDLPIDYLALGTHSFETITAALDSALRQHQPEEVRLVRPGY